jgi:hypothetical protein
VPRSGEPGIHPQEYGVGEALPIANGSGYGLPVPRFLLGPGMTINSP